MGDKKKPRQVKSVFTGKLLSLTRRVSKLSHLMDKVAPLTGKAEFGEAHDMLRTATLTAYNTLLVLLKLANPDAKNITSETHIGRYEDALKVFAEREKMALDAVKRANAKFGTEF